MQDIPPVPVRRVEFLDGLRGVAAVVVFCFHFIGNIFGGASRDSLAQHTSILVNGPYAVCIFFVLSGFVLAQSSAKLKTGLIAQVVVRYFRLMVPITASLLLALLWERLFPFSLHQPIGFWQVIQEGIWRVFWNYNPDINGPLWTMKLELYGSFLVYFCYRFYSTRFRRLSFVLFGIFAITRPYHLAFFLGALIREMWASRRLKITPWSWLILAGAFLLGFGDFGTYPYILGAALIVLSLFTNSGLQQFFSSRLARFLGRISFALYLVHAPILRTVGACIPPETSLVSKSLLVFILSLTASLALAQYFTVFLDEPLLRLLHKFKVYRERKI